MECGINSISVTPDTLIRVRMAVGKAEGELTEKAAPAPGGAAATERAVGAKTRE